MKENAENTSGNYDIFVIIAIFIRLIRIKRIYYEFEFFLIRIYPGTTLI